jgi:hypothetical protein
VTESRKRYSNLERVWKMSEGFRNVPGVPDGWELVGIRKIKQGDYSINRVGDPFEWTTCESDTVWPIIRKIEKPAKYRPFANAEEFKPHRDRWLTRKDKSDPAHLSGACRVVAYCDNHLWWADGRVSTYQEEFNHGRCFDDDGTPFGVKIDE